MTCLIEGKQWLTEHGMMWIGVERPPDRTSKEHSVVYGGRFEIDVLSFKNIESFALFRCVGSSRNKIAGDSPLAL